MRNVKIESNERGNPEPIRKINLLSQSELQEASEKTVIDIGNETNLNQTSLNEANQADFDKLSQADSIEANQPVFDKASQPVVDQVAQPVADQAVEIEFANAGESSYPIEASKADNKEPKVITECQNVRVL